MNEASPGTWSLTLKPRPSVKNRCDASWSSEPITTCPSLRGWTRAARSIAGARPFGPVGPARPVGRLLLGGRLGDPRADLHADPKR